MPPVAGARASAHGRARTPDALDAGVHSWGAPHQPASVDALERGAEETHAPPRSMPRVAAAGLDPLGRGAQRLVPPDPPPPTPGTPNLSAEVTDLQQWCTALVTHVESDLLETEQARGQQLLALSGLDGMPTLVPRIEISSRFWTFELTSQAQSLTASYIPESDTDGASP